MKYFVLFPILPQGSGWYKRVYVKKCVDKLNEFVNKDFKVYTFINKNIKQKGKDLFSERYYLLYFIIGLKDLNCETAKRFLDYLYSEDSLFYPRLVPVDINFSVKSNIQNFVLKKPAIRKDLTSISGPFSGLLARKKGSNFIFRLFLDENNFLDFTFKYGKSLTNLNGEPIQHIFIYKLFKAKLLNLGNLFRARNINSFYIILQHFIFNLDDKAFQKYRLYPFLLYLKEIENYKEEELSFFVGLPQPVFHRDFNKFLSNLKKLEFLNVINKRFFNYLEREFNLYERLLICYCLLKLDISRVVRTINGYKISRAMQFLNLPVLSRYSIKLFHKLSKKYPVFSSLL